MLTYARSYGVQVDPQQHLVDQQQHLVDASNRLIPLPVSLALGVGAYEALSC